MGRTLKKGGRGANCPPILKMAVLTISAGIIAAIKFVAAAGGLTALGAAAFKAGQAIGNEVKNDNVTESEEREAQDNVTEKTENKESTEEEKRPWYDNGTPWPTPNTPESQDPIYNSEDPNAGSGTIIQDNTQENIETQINNNDFQSWYDLMIKDRNERWAREDAIRKETQAREDSAWQRAVEDALKSGINPNLVNMSPAASGGGITQASGLDETAITEELEKYLKEIEQSFQGSENDKDRIMKAISNIITIVGIFAMTKGKKKK